MAANLNIADVILVGVSRSGKTPTSLYLAMQHGIKAANYPLIPDDFERGRLPSVLAPYKRKCFGLTIDPARLAQIRNERRPGSRYASLENCRFEVNEAEAMMRRESIAWLSSTHKSIEEIATTILRELAAGAAKVVVVPAPLFAGFSALESPAAVGFVIDLPPPARVLPHVPSVVLDRLQDPGNVGSVLRTAAAKASGRQSPCSSSGTTKSRHRILGSPTQGW